VLQAALIEIDGSHDECLYSQLLFLKQGGYHVTLICNEKLRERVQEFDAADKQVFFQLDQTGKWKELGEIWKIRQYLVRNKIETLIFNTAHGKRVQYLCRLLPSGVRFVGTMHATNKLHDSLIQKVINERVQKYFVLNDYLLDRVRQLPPEGLSFSSYYPIFFPSFKNQPRITKPRDEFWIAIPGQVEYKRRDYRTLVRAVVGLSNRSGYKFLLLGKSEHELSNGRDLQDLIRRAGVESNFIFWKDFVTCSTFHAYISQADVIMPLIHPNGHDLKKYVIHQISGAYNLAFAYKKPLLMCTNFAGYEDFRENSVFYDVASLSATLEDIQKIKTQIESLQPAMYRQPKWTFDYQAERYLNFIRT